MSGIAPHEGKELQMLLDGEKNFAVIEEHKDPTQADAAMRYAANSQTLYAVRRRGDEGAEVILWRGSVGHNKYQIYLTLVDYAEFMLELLGKDIYTRAMGRIFGYTDEEIQEFIDNPPKCNCTKCGGANA